jgi:hypothetical protein
MTALDTAVSLRDKYLEDHGLDIRDFGLNYQYPPIPPSNWEWYKAHRFSNKEVYGRTGLFLIYLNPQGEPWLQDEIPYGVVRFVGQPMRVPEGEKVPKVLSQWGRRSEIHFEPIRDGRAWDSLEHGTKVIHCESLVKAKAVHKATGFPCIGYNGVAGYSSAKQGLELIHLYTGFAFDKMDNVILFDSDVHTNPRVIKARESLSHKLRHIAHCSNVSWASLPQKIAEDGSASNWGPDDFILERGTDALLEVLAGAVPYADEEYAELVEDMNDRLRWVSDQNACYDRKRRSLIKFQDAAMSYRNVNRVVPWGKTKRTVYGTEVWLASTHRKDVDSVGYRYMGPEFFERGEELVANEYIPDGATPGDEGLDRGGIVYDMLTRLFKRDDLELLRSYLKFLKFSTDKPTSYCVLWSTVRGVGKGWFTDLAKALLGRRHVGVATADSLAEKYNLHTVNIRLLIAHEFKASSRSARDLALNYLKTYVGDKTIPVRAMHRNFYNAEVAAGLIITVNDKTEMPSDGLGDRRQWYVEAGAGLLERGVELWGPEAKEWERVWEALGDESEMARVAKWVEEGEWVDFKSWKPELTAERAEDLMEGQSMLVQVAHEVLVEARELGVLVMDGKAIRSLMLDRMEGQEIFAVRKAFGKVLREAGWWTDKAYDRATESKSSAWFTKPVTLREVSPSYASTAIRADSAKWAKKF